MPIDEQRYMERMREMDGYLTDFPDISMKDYVAVRRIMREFAMELKKSGWACKLPVEKLEPLSDVAIRYGLVFLPSLGVRRRPDWAWEADR